MKLISATLVSLMSSQLALAHDLWISSSDWRVQVGKPLEISLRERDGTDPAHIPIKPERVLRFESLVHEAKPMLRKHQFKSSEPLPSTKFSFDQPGAYILLYESNNSSVSFDAKKFEKYLREEGFVEAIAERERRNETSKPGRELYSRCVKALVEVGRLRRSNWASGSEPVKCPLEIIPITEISQGAKLRFKVLYKGKPLAKALVRLRHNPNHADASVMSLKGVTDLTGIVKFEGVGSGEWLVATVHMARLEGQASADWQSRWASLTFFREHSGKPK